MESFKKIVFLGSTETYEGGPKARVFCKITWGSGKLSISGVEGPKGNGDSTGSCGQIVMHRPVIENPAKGWTQGKIKRFWDTWERWHLNDMRAECQHQRARGETWKSHPMAECPDCGYKLGSQWLSEEVPQEILEWLNGLPESELIPAWV